MPSSAKIKNINDKMLYVEYSDLFGGAKSNDRRFELRLTKLGCMVAYTRLHQHKAIEYDACDT